MENQIGEINAIDVARFVVRSKKVALAGALIGMAVAGGAAWWRSAPPAPAPLPQTRQAAAVIETGSGADSLLESAATVVAKVNNGRCADIGSVSAAAVSGADLVTLQAVSSSSQGAADAVSACAKRIIDAQKQALNQQVSATQDALKKFLARGQQAAGLQDSLIALQSAASGPDAPQVISVAAVSAAPSPAAPPESQKRFLLLVFSLVAGAAAGWVIGAMAFAVRRWWVKNRSYIQQ